MEILVADDNLDVADTLAQMLRTLGHGSAVATNGPQALAIAKQGGFDACVVDLDLPPFGGVALLGSLRSAAGARMSRAVAWTAAEEVWRLAPAARLFDAFVAKPASIATIGAALTAGACPACARPLDVAHRHPLCQWTWP